MLALLVTVHLQPSVLRRDGAEGSERSAVMEPLDRPTRTDVDRHGDVLVRAHFALGGEYFRGLKTVSSYELMNDRG